MVQDTGLGQEMFITAYKKRGQQNLTCYRYTEDPITNNIPNELLSERAAMYCVSPPGETDWFKGTLYGSDAPELDDAFHRLTLQDKASNKKYPLPGADHVAAIVKFYDSPDALRVSQLVEVIGVLSHPDSSRDRDIEEQQQSAVDPAVELGSALHSLAASTPIIHAITYTPLEGLSRSAFDKDMLADLPDQAQEIRTHLIDYISTAFKGDKLAAELILLQLLSRVTAKNGGVKIGPLSLNISNFSEGDKTSTHIVASLLSRLVSHQVVLPLTVDFLNQATFMPKSIDENLHSGALQLVDGTSLIVDETGLSEGTLNDQGSVRNLQALTNVIQNQTLSYVFPYSQFDFDTDLINLTLSAGKSMLPSDLSLRLSPSYENGEGLPVLPEETLNLYRMYIDAAKFSEYTIPPDVSEYIQTCFVNERKTAVAQSKTLPSQDDLMRRVNLARLVSLSFGQSELTKESYEHAQRLDSACEGKSAKPASK
ncbi:putative alanine racemase-domain-containing protein [Syncephalastrum racemosum]|uniref:Putative alanine racemase-domain-containing protein n=1 Tax=Syncephalastrum racemosum TaxID=13706 RepID=A0A1X2HNM9_SYNRA|nr:putative alanine racemase-domain-containing protein [Syncephalastrum racemosum]